MTTKITENQREVLKECREKIKVYNQQYQDKYISTDEYLYKMADLWFKHNYVLHEIEQEPVNL